MASHFSSGAYTAVAGSSSTSAGAVGGFHPSSPSGSFSTISPHLGQTRSRTLLFLSYRDTAARTTKRPSGSVSSGSGSLYFQAPYTDGDGDGDGDPLNSSSVNHSEQQRLLGSSSPSSARNSHDRAHTSIELGMDTGRARGTRGGGNDDGGSELPPKWMDITDQVDSILASIRPRMDSLSRLHEKHLRPGFTNKSSEEKQIEALALSITQDFRRSSRLVAGLASFTQHLIREAKKGGSSTTVRQIALAQNVQTALASRVQDLSGAFRKQQTVYLRRMKGMEVRDRDIRAAQGLAGAPFASSARERDEFRDSELAVREDMELSRTASLATKTHAQSQAQDLVVLESSSALADAEIQQRDREITEIAKSIQELASLFGDLQTLVIDQGTMLDRIDFNVELMSREMEGAVKELEVATGYQRRTGRRQCILFLILCITLLVAILIIKPFWRFFSAGGAGGGGTGSLPLPEPSPASAS